MRRRSREKEASNPSVTPQPTGAAPATGGSNIAPTVTALVNGDPVDAEHRLRAGDALEFARPAGEKGGSG
jgi:hypothetical protein